jgi:hypothetical protein
MPTPNVIPGASKGKSVEATEVNPDEGIYVPVVNANYIPDGVAILEGFVPDHPADDKVLNRIKDAYESQGLVSGPEDVEEANAEAKAQSEERKAAEEEAAEDTSDNNVVVDEPEDTTPTAYETPKREPDGVVS